MIVINIDPDAGGRGNGEGAWRGERREVAKNSRVLR